jgi:hypothetical protein
MGTASQKVNRAMHERKRGTVKGGYCLQNKPHSIKGLHSLFPDCFHHLRTKIRIHLQLRKRIAAPIDRKNSVPFAMLCRWQAYAANQVHKQTRMLSSTA